MIFLCWLTRLFCFADNYDLADSTTPATGACLSGCAAKRCSGKGTCVSLASSGNAFNSNCLCQSGWRTSKNQVRINSATTKFAGQTYCDIPFDPATGKSCGYYGTEIAGTIGQNCVISTSFTSKTSVLKLDPVLGMYVQFCPFSNNQLFASQLCSGSDHGSCVPDGHYGYQCQCSNGYTGLDCSTLVGPAELYVNGAKCSGNGYISNPTLNSATLDASKAVCVCKENSYGTACEKSINDCNYGAPINSYPLSKNIPSILSS